MRAPLLVATMVFCHAHACVAEPHCFYITTSFFLTANLSAFQLTHESHDRTGRHLRTGSGTLLQLTTPTPWAEYTGIKRRQKGQRTWSADGLLILERWAVLSALLQEQMRRTLWWMYLCAMSDEGAIGAMPRELIWELARWITAVYGVK